MFPPFCVLCVLERSGVGQELAQDWPRVRIWSLYPPYMLSICLAFLFGLWVPALQGDRGVSPDMMPFLTPPV